MHIFFPCGKKYAPFVHRSICFCNVKFELLLHWNMEKLHWNMEATVTSTKPRASYKVAGGHFSVWGIFSPYPLSSPSHYYTEMSETSDTLLGLLLSLVVLRKWYPQIILGKVLLGKQRSKALLENPPIRREMGHSFISSIVMTSVL